MKLLKLFLHLIVKFFRQKIALSVVAAHHNEIYIGGVTKLSKNTYLGKNPNFNGLIVNGIGKLVIGDNFHSGTDCLIITSIHNYNYGKRVPYDDSHIEKPVVIGDNVWFGDRVTVIGKVTIGEGAIIQAGAVVVHDVPIGAIVGGNPAIVFKYRNMEHYNLLKSNHLFH